MARTRAGRGRPQEEKSPGSPGPRLGATSGDGAGQKSAMTLKRLRAKALDLLARRDHSERELEDKLLSRGGEESDVAAVLSDLRGIGLLDDRRFARGFVSYRSGKAWGPRRYRQELLSRGVAAELVAEVLSEAENDPESVDSDSKLRVLVEKELARGREAPKVMASLVRRGFDYGAVREAICLARVEQGEFP